jgi:hypothetical protein
MSAPSCSRHCRHRVEATLTALAIILLIAVFFFVLAMERTRRDVAFFEMRLILDRHEHDAQRLAEQVARLMDWHTKDMMDRAAFAALAKETKTPDLPVED